jgi:uncharacterized membrane protein
MTATTYAAASSTSTMRTRTVNGLAVALMLLAMAGLGVASYLTVVHYAHQPIACSGIGECEYVNSSDYATVAGVPVALLGALAYASMGALVLGWWHWRNQALLLAAWAISAISFAFSMYLTYIELRVLDAICPYCVASASVVTAVFAGLFLLLLVAPDEDARMA